MMVQLKYPSYPNPFWFSSSCQYQEGIVISDKTVSTSLGLLCVEDNEVLPEIGTKLRVRPERYYLIAETEEDIQNNKALIEQKIKEQKVRDIAIQKKIREDAEKANNKLNIPVPWTSGFKSVLSGLSENSNGNGFNKKTVIHILLEDDLNVGRLKRKSGSFLCTAESGDNGKEWVDLKIMQNDGIGSYIAKITCRTCLKIAERWKKD